MPRTPASIPDPTSNTIGTRMSFTRRAAGAAGILMTLEYPPDPDGAFDALVSQLTPASQTALVTIYNELIALYRTARGYV